MGPLQHPLPCSEVTLSGTRAWHRDLLPTPSLASPLALVKDSSARDVLRLLGTGAALGAVISAVCCELSKQPRARVNLEVVRTDRWVPTSHGWTWLGDVSLPELSEEQHVATGLQSTASRCRNSQSH